MESSASPQSKCKEVDKQTLKLLSIRSGSVIGSRSPANHRVKGGWTLIGYTARQGSLKSLERKR
eukprot:5503873-Amphidinium_carterae.2